MAEKKKAEGFGKKAFLFSARFFIVFAVLYALLFLLDFSMIENWLASLTAGFFGLQAIGNAVLIGGFAFKITESCIGLFSGIVLASIIFACRKPSLRLKLLMAFCGSLALFLLNIPRLYLVFWAALNYGVEIAEWAHFASWFSTTIIIIAVWYLLAERIAGKEFKELV